MLVRLFVFLLIFARSSLLFFLTVIAISTGILLAAILFMKEIADMTRVIDITKNKQYLPDDLLERYRVFKITAPYFAPSPLKFSANSPATAKKTASLFYISTTSVY